MGNAAAGRRSSCSTHCVPSISRGAQTDCADAQPAQLYSYPELVAAAPAHTLLSSRDCPGHTCACKPQSPTHPSTPSPAWHHAQPAAQHEAAQVHYTCKHTSLHPTTWSATFAPDFAKTCTHPGNPQLTWQHAQPAAQHVAAQVHTGQAIQVVADRQGQQWAQAQQRHKLEPVAADGPVNSCKALVLVSELCNLRQQVLHSSRACVAHNMLKLETSCQLQLQYWMNSTAPKVRLT